MRNTTKQTTTMNTTEMTASEIVLFAGLSQTYDRYLEIENEGGYSESQRKGILNLLEKKGVISKEEKYTAIVDNKSRLSADDKLSLEAIINQMKS